jgi:AcrR family transcriptional regulator
MAKKTYHHGDLRNALLRAAEKLLEDEGVAGITMREVARVAGVSHTAPYRHFADKRDLLSSLAQMGYQRLTNAMQDCVDKAVEDPLEQLKLAALAYMHLATRHPEMTNLMFGDLLKPFDADEKLLAASKNAFEGLVTIVRNGQTAGLFKDKDSQSLAIATWSQVHGLSMLITARHMGDLSEQALEHLTLEMVDLLFNGLKAD